MFFGYNKAFNEAKFQLNNLSNNQINVILFSASASLNSSSAMYNLGLYLEKGRGLEKDEKESVNYYLKSLEKAHLNKYAK